MKRLFLFLCFASIVSVAGAWVPRADEGVVILATKHLSPEAKAVVEKYLGTTYADDVRYLYSLERAKVATHTKEIHFVHLDKEFRPLKVEGDDALKALEEALEVVRNHKTNSEARVQEALRTAINLVCDIHNLSHYRIEGIPHSYKDFRFTRTKKDVKPEVGVVKERWLAVWDRFPGYHKAYSGNYWAEDMGVYSEGKYAEYTEGSLREWISQIGAKSAGYLQVLMPDVNISQEAFWALEEVNYDMMTRASLRLAKLLNETIR